MTTFDSKNNSPYLYQKVINLITDMQSKGTLQTGQKLPSLRHLASTLAVSVPTVKQAYYELETRGLIIAKPKSGYFLHVNTKTQHQPKKARYALKPVSVSRQQLIEDVFKGIHLGGNFPLGVANPVAVMPLTKALNRNMRKVMATAGDSALVYGPMNGYEPLRRQIAKGYLEHAMALSAEDIVITNGAQEALNIALQCVAKPGDVIAVESPCYFGILELIENLGMLALEIPVSAKQGLLVKDVEKAITKHPVKVCLFSSTISNPLGCILSDEAKQALVSLLEKHHIPLIEDDVYGDLYFNEKRGTPAQKYSQKGLVLTCSSFSKTAAPGYRIGWIANSQFSAKCGQIKRALSFSSSLINQMTLFEFLRSGEYERYIKNLRQALILNKARMISKLQQLFADTIRISDPQGGCVLWLELDPTLDSTHIFQLALQNKISICPGRLFSPSNRYQHCVRLSFGIPWSLELDQALSRFAQLCLQESTKK